MNVQTVNTSTLPQEQVTTQAIILNGVKWQTFKALMADVEDGCAWRIAYDQGVLEIRMPL